MKKGKFTCIVLHLKKRKVKDKTKYLMMGVEIYPKITKELACYYAYKEECSLMGIKHGKPCKLTETDTVCGYYDKFDEIIFCQVSKSHQRKDNVGSKGFIFPPTHVYGVSIDRFFHERIQRFIELFKDEKNVSDFSIECSCIWGPENLIPKGYEHITSGNTQEGDLYWYDDGKFPYWNDVNSSYSRFKLGCEIKTSGIRFVKGKDGLSEEDEIVDYYEPFVIRKKA